jgi:hypothetical protein
MHSGALHASALHVKVHPTVLATALATVLVWKVHVGGLQILSMPM